MAIQKQPKSLALDIDGVDGRRHCRWDELGTRKMLPVG